MSEYIATVQGPVVHVPLVPRQHVVVSDIEMPFGSMVRFMIKWAIAAIPAAIVLFLLGIIPG